ncbi:MAG: GNAT family N-acetyltransferase [Myxococcales bacterium]|nr:GNAT family N-acetyltransferase [Myxococcales bacterium]
MTAMTTPPSRPTVAPVVNLERDSAEDPSGHGEFRLIFEPRDGSAPVTIRPIHPEDRQELYEGFRKLSPTSRYQRFFSELNELSAEQLDYLTEVDGINHVALVAVCGAAGLELERGLGVARFVRLKDEPDVAEVAITVADDAQNKGIGSALLAALIAAARERGVHRFRMQVLSMNAGMIALLQHSSAVEIPSDGTFGDDVRVFEIPISAEGVQSSATHADRGWLGAVEALSRALTGKTHGSGSQ